MSDKEAMLGETYAESEAPRTLPVDEERPEKPRTQDVALKVLPREFAQERRDLAAGVGPRTGRRFTRDCRRHRQKIVEFT